MSLSKRTFQDDTSLRPGPNPSHEREEYGGVAIVGAGLSGLAAASVLSLQGHAPTVFDKGRGVGGRTAVRRSGRFAFDHGAQYFTVRSESLHPYLQSWLKQGIVEEWAGRVMVIGNSSMKPVKPQKRYVGVPGMNAVAKHLAEGIDVHKKVRVGRAEHAHDGWKLYDDQDGLLGTYEVLIVALPPAQAADLVAGQTPLAQQAASCEMAPCWAVMLGFDENLPVVFDAAFVHDSPLTWIANNGSKPGRPPQECWVLHGSPEWSKVHLEDPEEEVERALTRAFFDELDIPPASPAYTATHRWRYAAPVDPLDEGVLWDEDRKVAICGDWCYGARVEGAFLSGMAAADRVISC